MKSAWGSRPVTKKPSFSLIWAKWTAGGVSPFSSDVSPCDSADCTTWAEPSMSAAIADLPGGEMLWVGSRPSSFRNPPVTVEIKGL